MSCCLTLPNFVFCFFGRGVGTCCPSVLAGFLCREIGIATSRWVFMQADEELILEPRTKRASSGENFESTPLVDGMVSTQDIVAAMSFEPGPPVVPFYPLWGGFPY